MPAGGRARKWSVDKRKKQPYISVMLYNNLIRSQRLLYIIGFTFFLLVIKHYYSNSSTNVSKPVKFHSKARTNSERKINEKIVEIDDRQPAFKLYVYDGYNINADRNHARGKLVDNIKLQEKCKQSPAPVVLDVGASLGQFGFYAAACGCRVYMFEANPLKVALIEKSIQLNKFESHVTLISRAASDLPSGSQIYISSNMSGHSKVYTVNTMTLNELDVPSNIYLLRVDVQGYELHVFRGSEKFFRNNTVHHLLFEYTPLKDEQVKQKDLLPYIKDILGGKRFYALHPKEATLFGPLYNEDIQQFYTQHQGQSLKRDVYVLIKDEELNIDSKPYDFQTSY